MGFLSEQSESKPPLSGRRVLIVEDQYLIAMEMQDCIEKAGASVIGPVGRLNQAMGKAEKESIDVALLDVDLNGERCWPVADILVERKIPFVFTTGFATTIVMPERFEGSPVLSKPYREEDVLALLKKLLTPALSDART